MDISTVFTEVEAAISRQLAFAGDDPDIAEAAAALMAVLEPSLRQAGSNLAEQAAHEVSAQLPDYRVSVAMSDGEPQLVVQPRGVDQELTSGSNEARLTVRLPEHLKDLLERAAVDGGDSVNTFVVNALASKAKPSKSDRGNRIRTSIDL